MTPLAIFLSISLIAGWVAGNSHTTKYGFNKFAWKEAASCFFAMLFGFVLLIGASILWDGF